MKRLLKNIVGKLIELIERYEFRNLDLDENNISKKIIDSHKLENVYVNSDTGFVPATEVHRTQPYRVYEIRTETKFIECADNHILYKVVYYPQYNTQVNKEVWAKDLKIGDSILTDCGVEKILSIRKCPYKLAMYDLTIDSEEHRYYTNGVLSHNTTTISSFLSWMIIFHDHRNILVAANKEDTATEIVNKITNIFKELPYFLKPGCDSFGKTTLSLENGSRILSTATTNTASIGFTLHCVLLDEFAHIPDNIVNNFWRSVYPTLSSSKISQCIITSTPNGTTNKFYDLWTKSINHENSFVNLRTDYWEVPGHDDAWAAQQRADFGDEEFAQEFELQFNVNSKMLLKAEDLKWLDRFKKEFVHKDILGESSQFLQDEKLKWHPDFDPNNIEETDKFVFLVDLAEGVAEQEKKFKNKKKTPDSNTISIMKVVLNSPVNVKRYADKSCDIKDAYRYIQVGKYESNSEDEEYCASVCAALAYDWAKDDERESVKVMVEMNFNGKSFLQKFQRHEKYYDGTILKTYHTKPVPGERQRRRAGFKTTANKEYYCTKGAKLINMHRIIPTDFDTFVQMQSFGYVKGRIEGIACHDDLSMPIFNHIPRMLDEETFVEWLDDYFMSDVIVSTKKYAVNLIIEQHDFENPETSDSEFDAMYSNNSNELDIFNHAGEQGLSPYSSQNQLSPYSTPNSVGYNPYSSGNTVTYSSLVR